MEFYFELIAAKMCSCIVYIPHEGLGRMLCVKYVRALWSRGNMHILRVDNKQRDERLFVVY